ncbi:LamB/YcsF family protein [Veillonella sp. R32]|uniref:LamB/YcsF family protein n=1 Tax=Veillonella sp. R32 TaxID=2021312 RepID=UPI00138A5883|nr:5-oxoprolinase subunit PxpA [Veillonella sp. R32]KAF1683114.1 hypothetical protein VER_03240 [Veillonella sp. R32]
MRVDMNSDLGESYGVYTLGLDQEVLSHVTSANVACGWHAGDPLIMERTVQLCKAKGVAVGAHPSYPDLLGFGRRNMTITADEAKAYMLYQVGALKAFCQAADVPLQHVKLHGAFYNTACVDPKLASAVLDGIEALGYGVAIMALSGSVMVQQAKERQIPVIQEVFADRGYTAKGTLVPRSEPGAFVRDPQEALVRILQMVNEGTVVANTGETIPIVADSICVHGDNPEAVAFTKALREGLVGAGLEVTNFGGGRL